MPSLDELLNNVIDQSKRLFLHRQQLERQKNQILLSIQQTEMELIRLDGEETAYRNLMNNNLMEKSNAE